MLGSDISKRNKDQNQEQLSISNGSLHDEKYPFLTEFSELIADVSTKDLKNNLLTKEQKMVAESLWMANRSKKEIYPDYKPRISTLRDFYIRSLILDHKKQWDEYRKSANIITAQLLE